jgi:hypothetical protein
VSPVFRIEGGRPQVLQIDLQTPVNQSWVTFDLDLVNTQTKAVHEVSLSAEFWSGVADGEPWSEGSREVSELVPAVEPGEYRLVMDVDGSPELGVAEFHLEVTRDVMVWSNVIVGLMGLLAYPLFRWLREHTFERARWSVSSHSPYTRFSSSNDDDSDEDGE